MSASEKLVALNSPLPTNMGEWGDEVRKRGAVFLDALPQIIAVVEEAQDVVAGMGSRRVALMDALAALDEALS